MIVVTQCDEAEWLQHSVTGRPSWAQHFRHAVYRTGLRLEGDLDKVSRGQCSHHSQKATGHRHSLELGFGTMTVFQQDQG
jgi:hypothetical protein